MAKNWPNSTCWMPSDALEMVNIEAGTPDDADDINRGDHVFLASHQAPAMRNLTATDFLLSNSGGSPTSQEQVLQRLSDRSHPMLFITGAPGTGKSHLVRWLHIHATNGTRDGRAKDLFAHVPRSMTNLADVLQVILEHAEPADREDIRRKIAQATGEAKSEQALRERLLLTLSARLSELREEVIRAGATHQFGKRGYLEVLKSLPDFIASGAARALYRRDHGPADRIVRVRLQERTEGEDVADVQLRFTREDILADGALAAADDGLFGKDDLDCRARLLGEGDFLRNALELVDYCVDGAVRELVGLDATQLQHAMSRLLAVLGSRGQRLVLFFEDWGLIAGFQNQLVESFAGAKGDSVLAVIAITTQRLGQFQENILQRSSMYSLDRTEPDKLRAASDDLLARNLNAIRLGPQRLRAAFEDRADGAWVTNACDECPLGAKAECHRAFGAVRVDGLGDVGLYPMTHESIAAALLRKTPANLYVPRLVLSNVLRIVLEDATVRELADGRFPSARFADEFAPSQFRLEPVQEDTLRRALEDAGHPHQIERWTSFLETYRSRQDPRTHSAAAAAALGLHPIADFAPLEDDIAEVEDHTEQPVERGQKPKVAPPVEQPNLKPSPTMDGALAFQQGRQIASEDALRKVVAAAIRTAMHTDGRLNDDAWSAAPDGFDGNDVGLAATSRSGRAFEAALDPRTHGDALRGLVHLADGGAWGQLDLSRDRRLKTERAVDTWAQAVEGELLGGRHRSDVAAFLRVLIITGIAWGVAARVDARNAMNVALSPPPAPKAGAVLADSLRDAKVRQTLQEMLLRRVAFSQGRGAPVALDIAMLAPIIDEALADLRLPLADDLPRTCPDEVITAIARMEEDLGKRTKGLVNYLRSWWTVNDEDAPHLARLSELRDVEERLSSQLMLHPAGRSPEVRPILGEIRNQRVEVMRLLDAAKADGLEQLIERIPDHLAELEHLSTAEQLSLSVEFDSVRNLMASLQSYLVAVRTIVGAVSGSGGSVGASSAASEGPMVPVPPIEQAEAIARWAAGTGTGRKAVRRGR